MDIHELCSHNDERHDEESRVKPRVKPNPTARIQSRYALFLVKNQEVTLNRQMFNFLNHIHIREFTVFHFESSKCIGLYLRSRTPYNMVSCPGKVDVWNTFNATFLNGNGVRAVDTEMQYQGASLSEFVGLHPTWTWTLPRDEISNAGVSFFLEGEKIQRRSMTLLQDREQEELTEPSR